jgi:hypothetical protein
MGAGVVHIYLLKAALNAIRKHRGEPTLDAVDFLALVKDKLQLMEMDPSLLYRSVNEGWPPRWKSPGVPLCTPCGSGSNANPRLIPHGGPAADSRKVILPKSGSRLRKRQIDLTLRSHFEHV